MEDICDKAFDTNDIEDKKTTDDDLQEKRMVPFFGISSTLHCGQPSKLANYQNSPCNTMKL